MTQTTKKSLTNQIYNLLRTNKAMTNHEIAQETGKNQHRVNCALYRLKEKELIGKVGKYWSIGVEHQPDNIRCRVIELICEKKYDCAEIAEIVGVTVEQVSCVVSKLRLDGIKVKRIYAFDD